jgi:hypothetical protein
VTYTHTPAVELPWTSDQFVAETSTYTRHETPKTEPSILPAGFEPASPAFERPQARALDRASVGIGRKVFTTSISLEPQDLCTISQIALRTIRI